MVMALNPTTTTYSPSEDQSWLASAHGTQEMDPLTLDGALCAAVFPTGVVPSGTPLGKVTATGRYAPAVSTAADGSQTPAYLLFTTIDLTAGGRQAANTNSPASGLWHGEVISAKLPTFTNRVLPTGTTMPQIRLV